MGLSFSQIIILSRYSLLIIISIVILYSGIIPTVTAGLRVSIFYL